MSRLFRFIKGYVVVDAKGMNVERLLTICARNGIEVWHIIYKAPYCIRFSISLKDYILIRNYAVKLGIKMKHISRHGLAYALRNWRNKAAFLMAVSVLAFLVAYIHNHVWGFIFEGNNRVTDADMLAFFAEHDIQRGSRTKDIDFHDIEKTFRETFPCVTWVSMGMDRTSLKVRIVEEVVPFLPEEQQYAASSLYSLEEGIVCDMIVREGKAFVKTRTHVYPGELLVSGMLQYTDNNGTDVHTSFLNADADILLAYRRDYFYKINPNNLWFECRDPLGDYLYQLKREGLECKVISNQRITDDEVPYTKWKSEILVHGGGILRKEITEPGTDTGDELAYE